MLDEQDTFLVTEKEQAAATFGRWSGLKRAALLAAVGMAVVACASSAWRGTQRSSIPALVGLAAKPAKAQHEATKGKQEAAEPATAQHETQKGKEAEKEEAPCKMEHADDKPSLFCWSVMFDGDKDLIKSQFTGRAGMFACNDFMVLGKEEMSIGKDDCGVERKTVKKDLPDVEKGMYGVNGAMTSSWLNVPIFVICWDAVIESNKVWENDFTVKVDPDTVFFPGRLGYHMKEHVGKPVYTTDCRFWGGDPVGKLFGSIEVVSKEGIGAYNGNKQTCKDLPWQGWGEDYWLDECMNAIGVPGEIIADWVTDGTCPEGGYAECSDNFIAMHPYKDSGAWWDCWKKSNPEE